MAYRITENCRQPGLRSPCPTQAISGERHQVHVIDPNVALTAAPAAGCVPLAPSSPPQRNSPGGLKKRIGQSPTSTTKPVFPAACVSRFARSVAWRLNTSGKVQPPAGSPSWYSPLPASPAGFAPTSARWRRSPCAPVFPPLLHPEDFPGLFIIQSFLANQQI